MERRILEQRKRKNLPLRKSIYIYCNGETEAFYFDELRKFYRIKNELCVVIPSCSNRKSLVDEVTRRQKNIEKSSVEHVFIVFDADTLAKGSNSNPSELRSQVDNACSKCAAMGYTAIVSNEAFELWFLLHFENIQHAMHRDDLLKRVKKHIPDYEKANSEMFSKTYALKDEAIKYAKKLNANYTDETPYSQRNPSTNVYELVEKIESMKK